MDQNLLEQLAKVGLSNLKQLHHNLSTPQLYEHIIQRREGSIAHLGSLIVRTGKHTGRSAQDKFIVEYPENEDVIFWSKDAQATSPEVFEKLHNKVSAFMQCRELYLQDVFAGADPEYQIRVRTITQYAWHSLFSRNMFLNVKQVPNGDKNYDPDFTVIVAPEFYADPEIDGTNSETFVMLDFKKKVILIAGTAYAGEIKKSIFTVMNYLLPNQNVLSMHCSANIGKDGNTALFFGLSGTGKTTLSADPERQLIGDDEHGWSDNGIFNIEGGCYAKVVRIKKETEPDIFEVTRKFGTVMENVVFNELDRRVDFEDTSITENTRACYPIQHIPNIAADSRGGHPNHIIFLTFDAHGVLPPVSKLDDRQAMYQFLSGYTAKVGGTEKGLKGVQTVFSFCFGAPFMVHKPEIYARLMGEKVQKHGVQCWLVNTGYYGGPYGSDRGQRFPLKYTRRIIHAVLNNELDRVAFAKEPIFGFRMPEQVKGVPDDLLQPHNTWEDKGEFEKMLHNLARQFEENFRQYEDKVSPDILDGGPKVPATTT